MASPDSEDISGKSRCRCDIKEYNDVRLRVVLCASCKEAVKTPSVKWDILVLVNAGVDFDHAACLQIREPLLEAVIWQRKGPSHAT